MRENIYVRAVVEASKSTNDSSIVLDSHLCGSRSGRSLILASAIATAISYRQERRQYRAGRNVDHDPFSSQPQSRSRPCLATTMAAASDDNENDTNHCISILLLSTTIIKDHHPILFCSLDASLQELP
jgi:hypothetical protein